MKNKFYVYKHIRLDKNEVFYIGIGIKYVNVKTIRTTYPRAFSKNNRNIFWERIVDKTKYNIEIIHEFDTAIQTKNKEIELIKFYGRRDLGLGTLVNLTDGGDGLINLVGESRDKMIAGARKPKGIGRKLSEQSKKNISEGHKGLKHTTETKSKISEANRNRIISQDSRNKISIAKTGSRASDETKLKMSNSQVKKPVLQYDLEGNYIQEFPSLQAAKNYVGNRGNIGEVCLGNRKSSKGYVWKYKNNNNGENQTQLQS